MLFIFFHIYDDDDHLNFYIGGIFLLKPKIGFRNFYTKVLNVLTFK